MNETIKPATQLSGTLTPPSDKSISHRALIFAALADGTSVIENLLQAEDVLSTMKVLSHLGVDIKNGDPVIVKGRGLLGLEAPQQILDCGNSGTTMRLMLGVLAACPFKAELTGDDSLNKRPMDRVMEPLKTMGAKFSIRENNGRRIIQVEGAKLTSKKFELPVASAQVKSALLLAGLVGGVHVSVSEPSLSRDHTERMLTAMGAQIHHDNKWIHIQPGRLKPLSMRVPGDFSSASFFIVAALIVPHSKILLKDVGTNPTRAELLNVLIQMGGRITKHKERLVSGEMVCDLEVLGSKLKAASICGSQIPKLIDELPIFAIAASQAVGKSVVRDAQELRIKESDRISDLCGQLIPMGVQIKEFPDGFEVQGGCELHGGIFHSRGDHRIAMSLAVGGLVTTSPVTVESVDCVATSFPNFFEALRAVSHPIKH